MVMVVIMGEGESEVGRETARGTMLELCFLILWILGPRWTNWWQITHRASMISQ